MDREEFAKAVTALLLENTPQKKSEDGAPKKGMVIEGGSLTMTWTFDRLEVNEHEP